jgi:hypothetical protein
MGPRDLTASSIANLSSMVCYGCSCLLVQCAASIGKGDYGITGDETEGRCCPYAHPGTQPRAQRPRHRDALPPQGRAVTVDFRLSGPMGGGQPSRCGQGPPARFLERRKWRICDIPQVKAAAGEHYLSQAKEPTRSSALGLPTALSAPLDTEACTSFEGGHRPQLPRPAHGPQSRSRSLARLPGVQRCDKVGLAGGAAAPTRTAAPDAPA